MTDAKWNATKNTGTGKPAETTIVNSDVGLLNSYEYYMAYQKATTSTNYLNIGYTWRLITPYDSSNLRSVNTDGSYYNNGSSSTRPAIVLKSTVTTTSGDGSKNNPYILSGDKQTATTNTKLNTRLSGEYVNFDGKTYLIIGTDDNNSTKLVSLDYLRDSNGTVLTKNFSNNTTYGSGTTNDTYWDYYLTNTWYNAISENYKNMMVQGVFYRASDTDGYYKSVICSKASNTVTVKDCDKTTKIWTGYVGLPRYGEMFAGQFLNGISDSTDYWLINMGFDTTRIRYIQSYGGLGSTYKPQNQKEAARPAIYLSSSVYIKSGKGTEQSPYEIAMASSSPENIESPSISISLKVALKGATRGLIS